MLYIDANRSVQRGTWFFGDRATVDQEKPPRQMGRDEDLELALFSMLFLRVLTSSNKEIDHGYDIRRPAQSH